MAYAKQMHNDCLKRLRSEDVVNAFFRGLESIPFRRNKLHELYPGFTEAWDITATLQPILWEWVMACELSLA